MKKFMAFVYLIPFNFIFGLILIIIGASIKNEAVILAGEIFLGLVSPIYMVIIIVVGLVNIIKGNFEIVDGTIVSTNKKKKEEEDTKEEELSKIKDINNSYGYENRLKEAEYIGDHAANIYKNSSKKEKIFSWLFFGFLIANVILSLIFAFFNIVIGMIICFALFGGSILVALIVKTIAERISIHPKVYRKSQDSKIVSGRIKKCFLSSTKGVGVGNPHISSGRVSTVRIKKVVYRVTVTANNKDYTAYTEDFYEEGEVVAISLLGGKRAAIVDIEKLRSELLDKEI